MRRDRGLCTPDVFCFLKREVIKNRKKVIAFRRLFGSCAAGLSVGSNADLLNCFYICETYLINAYIKKKNKNPNPQQTNKTKQPPPNLVKKPHYKKPCPDTHRLLFREKFKFAGSRPHHAPLPRSDTDEASPCTLTPQIPSTKSTK